LSIQEKEEHPMTDKEPSQEQVLKQAITLSFGRAAPIYDQEGPRFFSQFGHRLVELAHVRAGARVLDVAAGRGAILFAVAQQVGPDGQVVGIDLAEGMVEQTQSEISQRGLAHATMKRMDAEDLLFADASFDYVFCGFSLFFFPNWQRALNECARVLKPAGSIAVSTWGKDDPRWSWIGDLMKIYAPQAWTPQEAVNIARQMAASGTLQSEDGVRAALRQAGFEQLRIVEEEAEFFYANEEQWWNAQWSHGARSLLERLDADTLASYKARAFENMQAIKGPDGLPLLFSPIFGLGVKPDLE
jgi:O-methyltransferase / aklanonic acid methyltransferase